jgi:hypothetical protein
MTLSPRQFERQAWYHAGSPDFLNNPMYVHIGSRQAAEDRVDPKNWDSRDEESFLHTRRNSGLYEVRLAHGARVSPEIESDEEMSYRFAPTQRHLEARERVGRTYDEDEISISKDFDAYPYVNEYEAKGSVSLLANPEKLRMVRRLR